MDISSNHLTISITTTQNDSEICQAIEQDIDHFLERRRAQLAVGIIQFALIPFTIVGNVLVIASVAVFKHMRSHFKVILVNLAVADMLVGVLTLPLHGITYMYPDLMICHKHFCYVLLASLFISTSSLYFLFVIAVDRFQAIMFPFSYHRPSKIRTLMVPGVWFLCVIMMLTIFLGGFYQDERLHCDINTDGITIFPKLLIYTPHAAFSLALIFNIIVVVVSRRRLRRKDSLVRNSNIASFNVAALLFFVSLACYFPIITLPILKPHVSLGPELDLKAAAVLFALMNSMLNPMIYFIMMPDFHSVFILFLTNPPWRWTRLRKHSHRVKMAVFSQKRFSRGKQASPLRQRTLSAAEIVSKNKRRRSNWSKISKRLSIFSQPKSRSIPEEGVTRSTSISDLSSSSSGFNVHLYNYSPDPSSYKSTGKIYSPDSLSHSLIDRPITTVDPSSYFSNCSTDSDLSEDATGLVKLILEKVGQDTDLDAFRSDLSSRTITVENPTHSISDVSAMTFNNASLHDSQSPLHSKHFKPLPTVDENVKKELPSSVSDQNLTVEENQIRELLRLGVIE